MSPAAVVGQQLTVSVSRGQNTPPAVDHTEHHQHHYTWTRHEQQFRRQAVSQWGAPEIAIKSKVFPYSLPSVGPGADPGVQAVSPQVT